MLVVGGVGEVGAGEQDVAAVDDDVRAWELHNDVWERVAERGEREAQVELHELARTWWAEPAPTR